MKPLVLGLLLVCIPVSSSLARRGEQQRVAEKASVPASVKEAPFTVALVERKISASNYKYEKPFCTGSIIDPEWVLTAAHCITNPDLPSTITIIAGADNVNQFSNPDVQRRSGKEVRIHPGYWKNRVSKYDVAVLRVDKFEFNGRVEKADLWAKLWVKAEPKAKVEYGTQECRVYGWGAVEKGIRSDVLRTATVKAVHGTKACPCFQMYQQRRLVCTRDYTGYLCWGDSGGPLVCENKIVAGVAHVIYNRKSCSPTFFGKLELTCNDPQTSSSWMYVCPMLGFIHEHVPSAPDQPKSCHSAPLTSIPTILQSSLCLVIAYVFT